MTDVTTTAGKPFQTKLGCTRQLSIVGKSVTHEAIEVAPGEWVGRPRSLGAGVPVLCPSCGQARFQTTPLFNISLPANPTQITLMEPFASYGWDQPVPDPSAGFGCLLCPECEAPLAPEGKLKLKVPA
jgi:hypothetical protein